MLRQEKEKKKTLVERKTKGSCQWRVFVLFFKTSLRRCPLGRLSSWQRKWGWKKKNFPAQPQRPQASLSGTELKSWKREPLPRQELTEKEWSLRFPSMFPSWEHAGYGTRRGQCSWGFRSLIDRSVMKSLPWVTKPLGVVCLTLSCSAGLALPALLRRSRWPQVERRPTQCRLSDQGKQPIWVINSGNRNEHQTNNLNDPGCLQFIKSPN